MGALTFANAWVWGADKETSREIFDAYAGVGGAFIDTANVYTNGTSEEFLDEFLKGRRDRFAVATKYAIPTDPTDPHADGNGHKNLVRSLEASLKRLGTDTR